MEVRPFTYEDIYNFEPLHTTKEYFLENAKSWVDVVLEQQLAWVGFEGNKIYFLAGFIRLEHGKYQAWTIHATGSENKLFFLTKKCKEILDNFDANRIEMTVIKEFEQGHRWARMLGFVLETPNGMKNFNKNETHFLYSRCK